MANLAKWSCLTREMSSSWFTGRFNTNLPTCTHIPMHILIRTYRLVCGHGGLQSVHDGMKKSLSANRQSVRFPSLRLLLLLLFSFASCRLLQRHSNNRLRFCCSALGHPSISARFHQQAVVHHINNNSNNSESVCVFGPNSSGIISNNSQVFASVLSAFK